MPLSSDSPQVRLSIALAKEAILKFLPLREFWFSAESLGLGKDNPLEVGNQKIGETGKLVTAISAEVGTLNAEIRDSKDGFFLLSSTEERLDAWGTDLEIPRKLNETDDEYKARILKILQEKKLTKPAIESFLQAVSGLQIEVFEPWRLLEVYDKRLLSLPLYSIQEGQAKSFSPAKETPDRIMSRSGRAVRGNSYWQAGVIDVKSYGFSVEVRKNVPNVAALGVKPYFTAFLESEFVDASSTINFPLRLSSIEVTRFVPWFMYRDAKYSGTFPRSGNRETFVANELFIDRATSFGEDTHLVFNDLEITIVSDTLLEALPTSELWRWYDLIKLAYDEVIAHPSDFEWHLAPDKISYLTNLWDMPEYQFLSVWDTFFSWDELDQGRTWDDATQSIRSNLTWDDAIIIGYFDVFRSEFSQFDSAGALVLKDW